MFLTDLTIKEKSAFYFIAEKLVKADNVFNEKEQIMLDQFLSEMQVKKGQLYQLDYKEALESLKIADSSVKSKIFIELIALAECDDDYADTEKDLIEEIRSHLEIPKSKAEEIEQCVADLLNVYKKIGKLISD